MTPFFQASCRSLAHQFTLNAPLLCLLFSIFRKFLHFQPCFGQNSSSLDPNFSKFSFTRPPFFQGNPLPRPYILKPTWHTPTKKKLSAPPRADNAHTDMVSLWYEFLRDFFAKPLSQNSHCNGFSLVGVLRKAFIW